MLTKTRRYGNAGVLLSIIFIWSISMSLGVLPPNWGIPNSESKIQMSQMTLHTDGQDIKDFSGNIVYLRGVCKGDFLIDATGYFSVTSGVGVWSDSSMRADVDKMASYGFKLVRIMVNMDWFLDNSKNTWNGANTANRGFTDCLTDYIAYLQTKGMYALIAPWQVKGASASSGGGQTGGETDPWGYAPISTVNDFASWWGTVSVHFQGYNNVLFDLWNEEHGDYSTWMNAVTLATRAIRSNSEAIVVVQYGYSGDLGWVTNEWNSRLESLGNIAISQHIYRSTTFGNYQNSTSLTAIANVLNNQWHYNAVIGRYPFICGEIAAYIGGVWGDDAAEQTWHRSLLSELNSWGAGYCEWIWDSAYGEALAVQNSQRGTLTWAGTNLVNAIAAG